jgi:serine protease
MSDHCHEAPDKGARPGTDALQDEFLNSATRVIATALAFLVMAGVAGCGGGGTSSFTVTATATTGGSISPQSIRVNKGKQVTFTVTPSPGYGIQGVTGCGGSLVGGTYTTAPISAACTVSATFAINRYRVTAVAGAGGSISPTTADADHGSTLDFTVTADSGYLIDAVSGCGGTLQDTTYTTGPITGECEVQATFRLPAVSGTVIPAGGTAADSDVNDPLAPYAPNDDFPEAQLIPNPVTLGGYVNEPGAGSEGRSFTDGDEFDVFRVGLADGQVAKLLIASEDEADDLDLYLVDLNGLVVDASLDSAARVESVAVPANASGEYFLAVHAFSGASNYLLNIGQPAPDLAPAMRLSDTFVPGELIVALADTPGPKPAWVAELTSLGTGKGREQEAAPRSMLVRLDGLARLGERIAAAGRGIEALQKPAEVLGNLAAGDENTAAKLETLLTVKALARDPAVAAAAPNYLYDLHAAFTPNDPHFQLQWHYPQVSLPQAWSLNSGTGVIVAVIDSGVFLEHPDLAGRLVDGHDFILGIPGGNDPGDDPVPPGGSTYHGTHVAGTVAAATDNGTGVAGVAFGATVMPLRVCTTSGCPGYAIEQALRFAAGLPNDSGTVPPQTAGVVNLSLGRQGGPALASEQALFDELRARDIVVVASAGNSDTSEPGYPAAYQNVLAVSAVDMDGNKAYYSNFGSWIDVAAPGGDLRRDANADGFPDGVLSTIADDREGEPVPRYSFLQGTSMASPHVAGVTALMRSAVPAMSAQDIENLLRNGVITDDLGAPGRDDIYGHGLVNAAKAVTEALNTGGEPVTLDPFMSASPPSANFGATLTSISVVLSNSGAGELEIGTPSEDSGGWLGLVAEESEDRLILTLSAQRDGLAQGVYAATVTVPSSANTVNVAVFMQVADVLSANIALQYVLLIDPESFATQHAARAAPDSGGNQTFRIENVVPGSYLLVSGSDVDNDDFICDAGESCGIFRGPGDVVPIEVDGDDIENLEFTSGYGLVTSSSESLSSPGHGVPLERGDRAGAERAPRFGR